MVILNFILLFLQAKSYNIISLQPFEQYSFSEGDNNIVIFKFESYDNSSNSPIIFSRQDFNQESMEVYFYLEDSIIQFENQTFINFDDDISEMNVDIKQYQTIKKKNLFLDSKKSLKPTLKLKNKLIRLNTINSKNCDSYSITTNFSYNDKTVKKVTFSTVEIIRVEKYKKYNAKNNFSKISIQKNMEEVKNNNNEESACFIF